MDQADALIAGLAEDVDGHFEPLVRAFQDRLYRFALGLAGNPQDAEEIAQDSFIRAYRALAQYPPDRIRTLALCPWLYQICLNVFRNRVRRHTLHLVELDDDLLSDGDRERPEQVVEAAERRRELVSLLAALPARYRAAVILRHIEELGIPEIAAVLQQPEGTVKSNIHRGIRLLRRAVTLEVSEVTR
jgi:RNA polymerase sigma-70 factor (ECF subfamily)